MTTARAGTGVRGRENGRCGSGTGRGVLGGNEGGAGYCEVAAPAERARRERSYRAFTSARSLGARIVSTTFASVSPRTADGFGT